MNQPLFQGTSQRLALPEDTGTRAPQCSAQGYGVR
jgi:hypothetical protein